MADGPALPAWGPVVQAGARTLFRLWAPDHDRLTLRLDGRDLPMEAGEGGWFRLEAPAAPGTPYAFVLPDGMVVPDPASRLQQDDVHGPSLVPAPPSPPQWCKRPWEEAVICELHVGTFTSEGTFLSAAERLDALAETGFTAIELMPVAQFGGERGWGYDGVLPYAPHPAYGRPDDLRALVRAAHDRGMLVLLDVVYNHFGPDGNYLHSYAEPFFDEKRHTPWGAGIDYTRRPVRDFFIDNAVYWLEEFGFDGLRLDAVDQIRDPSSPDLLEELARTVRARLPGCPAHLTTEDNRNIAWMHERENGAPAIYTAEWNDDFHNAAHVVATGEDEGYYQPFAADPAALLARALAEGFAFQGPERGEPSAHLPPAAFVDFLQNHDQAGNRALGERLISLTDPETLAALQAIHLLSPHIPLMFMGEDWDETRPFYFFADFGGDLGRAVTEGRRGEFEGFSAFANHTDRIPDPNDPATFAASRIDWTRRESTEGHAARARVRRLLELRAAHVAPRLAATGGGSGRVLAGGDGIVAVDWDLGGARLQLRANLGAEPADLPPAEGDTIHLAGARPGAPRSAVHLLKAAP